MEKTRGFSLHFVKTFPVAIAAAIVVLIGAGVMFAAGCAARPAAIGAEKAADFALADAGIEPAAATAVRTELEYENGGPVYLVEFISGDTEYEYLINAADGAIIKKELDVHTTQGTSSAVTQQITPEEARKIALADAGLTASEADFMETEMDWENGGPIYEIKFRTGNVEYQYKLHADTGSIYSKGTETHLVRPATSAAQSSAVRISLDAARDTAFSDAGVSGSDVVSIHTDLEDEDGAPVYEIEFRTAKGKYKYEIHAVTGAILRKDAEGRFSAAEGVSSGPTSDIGLERAKSIAAGHASLSPSDVSFTKTELENEDGYQIYEIEFFYKGMEYEYEILAATGEIIKLDWDTAD